MIWGSRVVVPKGGHEKVLDVLHNRQSGVSRMKALDRSVGGQG